MLMPKLPLMPGTDTTDLVTADTMADTTDTVWDTTDTDMVWDTVATITDTDIPVLTVMPTTTLARGLLMPNLKPKPKLIPPLMLGTDTMAVDTVMAMDTDMVDTMVDTVDTMAVDTDMAVTDTTVKKTVLDCNILPFFK
jgi:hypothetical protein